MKSSECGCCGKDAETYVCSSGLGPISLSYCAECVENLAEPEFMFDATFDMTGELVADHVKQMSTFKDGKYIKWEDWVRDTRTNVGE